MSDNFAPNQIVWIKMLTKSLIKYPIFDPKYDNLCLKHPIKEQKLLH